MPRHEFVEGRLGTFFSVEAEELSVVVHDLFTLIAPAAVRSGQNFADRARPIVAGNSEWFAVLTEVGIS